MRQFVAPVALRLATDGHRVQCACTPGPHWDELGRMGVDMVAMPIARSANPLEAAGAVWRLYRWLQREKPDVLHVHTPVASLVGRLAAWLARVPVIVYTAHGFYFHDRMPAHKRRIHVTLERLFGRLNDFLFCVSSEDVETAKELDIAREGRVFWVPNGASSQRFDPTRVGAEARAAIRAEFAIPQDAVVVAIMGRLVREKGYAEFFAAGKRLAPEFPKLHFLVIGDTVVSEHDDAKAAIVGAAKAPELEGRVHFTGLRRDIPELLAASDLFTLPSYREGMPVSILEAMMMGLPVVATRIRGCREEVDDGRTGFLVKAQDADELHGALQHLLARPERLKAFGEAGRAKALAEFDEQRKLDDQAALYARVVEPAVRRKRP